MRRYVALALVLSAAIVSFVWFTASRGKVPDESLGLFTSLPILWTEAHDLKDMLDSAEQPHWAGAVLGDHGRVLPLDTLLDLAKVRQLIIAQPRPLTPDENVALDAWVRGGGQVLFFADPMLTHDSLYPLGDRRRPQDVALVSPILARWGLELRFDEDQPAGERESAGERLPVNLPGEFTVIAGGADADCVIGQSGLIARCRVGKGRALLVADAALLERGEREDVRASGLHRLLNEAFGR